jgi:hypothetical protein
MASLTSALRRYTATGASGELPAAAGMSLRAGTCVGLIQ